jgi:acetoacetyl-CoA synthetase
MQPEPQILRFERFLRESRGLEFADYESLWRWSVTDLRGFWGAIWAFFDIQSDTPYQTELVAPVMPGAQWFPGARVNYARQVLRHGPRTHAAGQPAIVFQNERMAAPVDVPWPELQRQVAVLATRCAAWACSPATACAPTCPTCRRRWSPSWPVRRWARCGRSAAPTWGRWRCSTASARSRRWC